MILTYFHLLFFLFFVFLASPVSAEQSYGCPPFEEAKVVVRPLLNTPKIDTSQRLTALRAMASSKDQARFSSTSHETPVGLTAANLKFDSSYQIVTKISPRDHKVCTQIGSFNLTFGFEDTTVYIAHELPYGSCSYKTVLEHEFQHVQTDRNLVRLYAQKFPALLKKAIREIGVLRVSSAPLAESMIRDTVSRYMHDLSKNLSTVREKQQLKIDTKEEYARLSKSCNGRLSKIIARASR
ncbi:MAG TPA: hypothetical protein DD400_00125 [Rhodospirillaceae bacterium]|nr:hypothetical protein [Rhodospirillaceae bacterium]